MSHYNNGSLSLLPNVDWLFLCVCYIVIVVETAKMFSAQNKIQKDKGVAPTEFEEQVAQVLASFPCCIIVLIL